MNTPLSYYHWLRKEGYTRLNAKNCTLMRFSPSRDDLHRRVRRDKAFRKVRQNDNTIRDTD